MTDVTLTAALRSNLLSLQGTQTLLDQSQLRLATGKKVNSALDNPSSYFASQSLTQRAGDLGNLLDSMGQAIQTMKATDQGLTSLTTLVQQAQAVAETARDATDNSGFYRSGDINAANVASLTTSQFANGDWMTVSVNGSVAGTLTITTGETLAQLASALNGITNVSATIVDGSAGATAGAKRLEIRATGGNSLTLTNGGATTTVAKLQTNGAGASGFVGVTGAGTSIVSGTAIASTQNVVNEVSLEKQYANIRTQIDSLVTDTSYAGTNLLNGDTLRVQFDEKNTAVLSVTGVTYNSAGLNLNYTTGATSTQSVATFWNSTSVTSSLSDITSAESTIRLQQQSFGNNLIVIQTRQDFTQNQINTLKAGSDALTLADKNEEGTNLLALQTAQQLGIQALALASQANQSVLRLFQ